MSGLLDRFLELENPNDYAQAVCRACGDFEEEGEDLGIVDGECMWCRDASQPCRTCGTPLARGEQHICWSCLWVVEQEVKRRRVDEGQIRVEEIPQRVIRRYREVGRA